MHRGAMAALTAAMLFGAGTPLAKLLLAQTSPWLLAGLLYLGSGLGLWLYRILTHAAGDQIQHGQRKDWVFLIGAVIAGGVIGPILLMLGLSLASASNVSLLLNAEGLLTALLAWFVFHENVDRRIALGMLSIVAGGIVLAWPSGPASISITAALPILLACLAWAIDNNLTRKVSLADASWIAMIKGLAAGATNLALALVIGGARAEWPASLAAGMVGMFSYGASLMLFVVALRQLGAARTGAYFSVAPFFGVLVAIMLLDEPITPQLLIAALLMAIGVALHLTERHVHAHRHEALEHDHDHVHEAGDEHHDHAHATPVAPGTRHRHRHRHTVLEHAHPHYPDSHHQHRH
jgi:drug/metabolite transporter (DMT)-like permease